ncbi:MAG: hypothetical protein WC867_07990 [Candidatus Pacearchaeota archaeon]|jgi:hypothetical protein
MQCTYEIGESCCCEPVRKFMSKEEKIEMLKEYQDSLALELESVSEELNRLMD